MKNRKAFQRILLWIDGSDMVRPVTLLKPDQTAGDTDSRTHIVFPLLKWSSWVNFPSWSFSCPIDRASLYNPVNETNLVHKFFSQCISSILFITCTCFEPLQVYHEEEKLYFMRHLALVVLYSWLSGMQEHMLLHTRQSAIQNNEYQVSHKYSSSSNDGPLQVRNM